MKESNLLRKRRGEAAQAAEDVKLAIDPGAHSSDNPKAFVRWYQTGRNTSLSQFPIVNNFETSKFVAYARSNRQTKSVFFENRRGSVAIS